MTIRRRIQEGNLRGSVQASPYAVKRVQYSRAYTALRDDVQRLKKQVSNNRPETKVMQHVFTGTTVTATTSAVNILAEISQGLASENRVGSSIRVKRVELVCGAPTNQTVASQTFCLVRPHDNDNPIIGDFTGGKYSMYDTTSGWEIWRYHSGMNDNRLGGCDISKSFGHGGMKVTYEQGSTNPTRNPLYWVHINRSGSSVAYELTVRVWFTDA